jgi:hypothetical protein
MSEAKRDVFKRKWNPLYNNGTSYECNSFSAVVTAAKKKRGCDGILM